MNWKNEKVSSSRSSKYTYRKKKQKQKTQMATCQLSQSQNEGRKSSKSLPTNAIICVQSSQVSCVEAELIGSN